jgi:hypothetical protein
MQSIDPKQRRAPRYRAEFVALGVTTNFQNISRRLTAMQHIEVATRKRWWLIGMAVALVGTVTVLPWRVVAQEAKTSDAKAAAGTAAAKAETDATKSDAAKKSDYDANQSVADPTVQSKRIVGAWRDAAGKEVVFAADGTYADLGVNVYVTTYSGTEGTNNNPFTRTSRDRGDGGWKIADGKLNLTKDVATHYWTGQTDGKDSAPHVGKPLTILRLDDQFLRLKYSGGEGTETYFLRKVDEQPIDERYAAVPAETRQFFAAAQFTPAEAQTLIDLFTQYNIDVACLKTIDQIQQVRRGKQTLQHLFGMSAGEVAAFRQLVTDRRGLKESLDDLVDNDQLAADEASAYSKIKTISAAFETLGRSMPYDNQINNTIDSSQRRFIDDVLNMNASRGSRGGRGRSMSPGFAPNRPQIRYTALSATQNEATEKLFSFLYDLHSWYRSNVFSGLR